MIYPSSALQRCPETLEAINLSQAEWNALSPNEQLSALNRQGRAWVVQYFKCAIRHNTGADVYEEGLRARDAALSDAEPKPEPEKPKGKFLGLF